MYCETSLYLLIRPHLFGLYFTDYLKNRLRQIKKKFEEKKVLKIIF